MSISDFSVNRRAMIDSQLRTSGIMSPSVIAAMGAVPRENFVPKDLQSIAYMDRGIPLATGRMLNPPIAAGLILEQAEVTADDRILLIGASTGYLTALHSGMGQSLVAVEENAELYAAAQENLAGQKDLTLVLGPLADGAPDYGPYTLVIIDGSIQNLLDTIVEQISEGGRIITGQNEGSVSRLASGYKRAGKIALRAFADTEIAPLPGFASSKEFVF
jgi:protein-L-isoaspartate(D-aspartate) O-methyltransferase